MEFIEREEPGIVVPHVEGQQLQTPPEITDDLIGIRGRAEDELAPLPSSKVDCDNEFEGMLGAHGWKGNAPFGKNRAARGRQGRFY